MYLCTSLNTIMNMDFNNRLVKKSVWCLVVGVIFLGMTGCKDNHKIVEPKEGPAHLIVRPAGLNIGVVPQGSGIIEKEVAMINEGSEDLLITNVENLCSCTKTEYADKPISPGHGRTLRIFLDTNHLTPGGFSRTVIIHSNGGEVAIDMTGQKVN